MTNKSKRAGTGGTKQQPKKQTLNEYIRRRPSIFERERLFEELTGTSDRACGLIGGAMTDNGLRALLAAHMRSDWPDLEGRVFDGPTAPLSGFHSRIQVAYAFDLISSKDHDRLDAIRSIRNAFAHAEQDIRFDNPLLNGLCARLGPEEPGGLTAAMTPNRRLFINATVSFWARLWDQYLETSTRMALAAALRENASARTPDKGLGTNGERQD